MTLLLEWSADCNGDGIVDYGQIRRGDLADFNGNNIPDCCEAGNPCSASPAPEEWKLSEGGNGHWYQLVIAARIWGEAEQLAISRGGHLASLTSESEANVLRGIGYRANIYGAWIGLTYRNGGWIWVTGEPLVSLGAFYMQLVTTSPYIAMIDMQPGAPFAPAINSFWSTYRSSYFIEWDSDCNADGQVDYGQIVRGELADANSNGVPDICEAIRVPADHATIQAAIDAATPNQNMILVSEGTYTETIDFKGKAITVKADGDRANTIIDGTGKTTSVVRAVTGETLATVLEGFTIRNGPVGSQVGTNRLGGGMFIDRASPTIRNCAFVNNAAGYGGGLYGLYSSAVIENCTVTQNTASTDGGGVQFFGGSPVIRNCVVSDNLCTNRGGGMHLVQFGTSGAPRIESCIVTGNRAEVSEGGGISIAPSSQATSRAELDGCTITGNTSQGRGAGVYAPWSTSATGPSARLQNNTICGNTSAVSKRENTWLLFEDGGNTICDCLSDIDGDGGVEYGDVSFALLFMGDPTDPDFIQPDQDMNGLIDTGDIALLLLNFGDCPAP
jgi:hypothetical protein